MFYFRKYQKHDSFSLRDFPIEYLNSAMLGRWLITVCCIFPINYREIFHIWGLNTVQVVVSAGDIHLLDCHVEIETYLTTNMTKYCRVSQNWLLESLSLRFQNPFQESRAKVFDCQSDFFGWISNWAVIWFIAVQTVFGLI